MNLENGWEGKSGFREIRQTFRAEAFPKEKCAEIFPISRIPGTEAFTIPDAFIPARNYPGTFQKQMATQRNDIQFGTASEIANLDLLQNFLETTLERKGGYAIFDYENPTKTVFVELKSRRIAHDKYPTAIIGANKVAACDDECQYWFAFCYTDGIYVIKYEKMLFDGFERNNSYLRGERSDCYNREQSVVYIPVEHLTKLEWAAEQNSNVE
jgi:hypothetical protein